MFWFGCKIKEASLDPHVESGTFNFEVFAALCTIGEDIFQAVPVSELLFRTYANRNQIP